MCVCVENDVRMCGGVSVWEDMGVCGCVSDVCGWVCECVEGEKSVYGRIWECVGVCDV